jgi:hypothetical protein
VNNLRFGPENQLVEKISSAASIFYLIMLVAFPIWILVIYWRAIKSNFPLPDLEDLMEIEDV